MEEGFFWAEWEIKKLGIQTCKNVSHLYKLDHIKEGKVVIENLINKYNKVTSTKEYDTDDCALPPLHIDTGYHEPIYISPRCMSPHINSNIGNHIQNMYKDSIIAKSSSPRSFPLVSEIKRDGDVRGSQTN